MAGSEPFENPLIPNARLREIYLAMLRARRLEESLPPKQRAWTMGLEACLVASAIDLRPTDVISDAIAGMTIRFLRGSSLGEIFHPGKRVRKTVYAGAGCAGQLPAPAGAAERLWSAVGAAAALRFERHAKSEGRPGEDSGSDVAVIYLRPGEIPPLTRRSAFGFAAQHLVPAVFVVLPSSSNDSPSRTGAWTGQVGIPVIPVDRDDAVAIYRVSQESIGRARMGGGPAVIECVPFVVKGGAGSGKTRDALRHIEGYILERAIVTPEWIQREAQAFAGQLALPVH